MANDEMTPGEIARALERIERGQREHGDKLDAIRAQTTATNGQVIAHAGRLDVADREIMSLKGNHARVVWAIFGLVLSIIGGITVAVVVR